MQEGEMEGGRAIPRGKFNFQQMERRYFKLKILLLKHFY